MICKDPSKLWTISQMMHEVTAAVHQLSPKKKAQVRVHLRKVYNLPAKPEPDLYEN